ncbi:MAG: hypothetical protein J6M43_04100 [Neisseriaceae bacterium]|nr:hypothetical protein [Neisseriaceae bacterium]
MEQNNNAWAKQQFKLHRNSRMARQDLIQAKSDFNNGKSKIKYRMFIPVRGADYFINIIKNIAFFYLVVFVFLFVPVFIKSDISFYTGIKNVFFNAILNIFHIHFFALACFTSWLISKYKIFWCNIDRENKIVFVNSLPVFWKKIQFEWHSNHYLPELSLPETEQEKYKEMQQNLQQAIALETGLKFDTQQFLLQNKGKLGI